MRKPVARASPRTQRLTDHIRPGVRVLFVGINPGLRSAATGHHFAGHSNRFWKLLFESNLVSERLTYREDWRVPEWGLGLTNVIRRASAGIDVLMPSEYLAGKRRLLMTVKRYRPIVVALLGMTIYRILFPRTKSEAIYLGLQSESLGSARIFVLPNPSGRNAYYPYRTMLRAFRKLTQFTDMQQS
jgi:double-stranded uracil-DNA glycosylase